MSTLGMAKIVLDIAVRKIGEVTLMRPMHDVSDIEHGGNNSAGVRSALRNSAETRDRTGDLQIFSLTLSQLSYRGLSTLALKQC